MRGEAEGSDVLPLAALLAAASLGDHEAFAALYDGTAAAVYGIVLRVLRDPAQSEEVTQEVYLEIWNKAGRYDQTRGSAMTWIMTIAHSRAVDRVRSEQSQRERIDRAQAIASPAFDEVVESIERDSDRTRVGSALENLTDLQREAIELAYFGGYTYREVAEILDAPLGTVKTRLRDGLRRLGAELGEWS